MASTISIIRCANSTRPDIIKSDISLVRDIHCDKDKQDLVAALMEFSRRRRSILVAEGLEAREELTQLVQLGVEYVQGYLLSRPGDVSQFRTRALDCYARVIFDDAGARQDRTGASS